MESEFHLFTSLPTEMRLKIWDYALRSYHPSRPGAHFFSVTNFREDGDELKNLRVQCHLGSRCENNHGYTYHLAAPKFSTSHSWTNNNPSSYLWDFGMWGACRESREIIEDHYKMEYWAAKLVKDSKVDFARNLEADACVPFICLQESEDWRFAIRPNQDLICIQPLNPLTIGYNKTDIYFMEDICMVKPDTGLRGIKHVAFEYDSSWCDDLVEVSCPQDFRAYFEEKSPRGLFIRFFLECKAFGIENNPIWLIDYGLKQDPLKRDHREDHPRPFGREHMTFYANNQKFVEVDKWSENKYESTQRRSALYFLAELDFMLRGDDPEHVFHLCQGPSSWSCFCETCDGAENPSLYRADRDVRILACERDE